MTDGVKVVFTASDIDPASEKQQPTAPSGTAGSGSQPVNIRAAIVNAAQKYLGAAYLMGAQLPPSKFDCSGFVNQVYKDVTDVVIPRSSSAIWAQGRRVDKNQVQPGDIIVFSENGSTASHVAIYMNSTEMIHSVSIGSPTGVIKQNQNSGNWPKKQLGFVSFIEAAAATTASKPAAAPAPAASGPAAAKTASAGTGSRRSRSENSTKFASGMIINSSGEASKNLAVTVIPVEVTRTQRRHNETISVLAGSALQFDVSNRIGNDGQLILYFYKVGTSREDGEKDLLSITRERIRASKPFITEEPGQYRLEVIDVSDNRIVLEHTYNVIE